MDKKRFWLKLQENFFNSDNMIYLESIQNGERYILLWLKILLRCLKSTELTIGFLRFTEKLPYTDDILSRVLRVDLDTIRVGLKYFSDLGMIKILDDGTLYVEEVLFLIGKESESAERVRKHREKAKTLLLEGNKENCGPALQCNNGNATCNANIEVEVEEEVENKTDTNVSVDRSKKKKTSDQTLLTRYFFERFEARTGIKPQWGAKEGSLLKTDLTRASPEQLKTAMFRFFNDPPAAVKAFQDSAGFEYVVFRSQIARLVEKEADPTESKNKKLVCFACGHKYLPIDPYCPKCGEWPKSQAGIQ